MVQAGNRILGKDRNVLERSYYESTDYDLYEFPGMLW